MNITVNADTLTRALAPLTRIAAGRSTLPIYTCVHLAANRDTLAITATDGDQTMAVILPADGHPKPSEICVNAAMLLALLRGETGSATLSLDACGTTNPDDTRLLITTPGITTRLAVVPGSDFPEPAADDPNTAVVTIDAETLAAHIDAIKHGACTDETRYIINSVALVFQNGSARIVCTDGRRLGYAPIPATIDGPDNALPLHIKSVGTIRRLLSETTGDVKLNINGNRLHLDLGGDLATAYTCKLCEGTYPNIDQVIPTEATLEHSITFGTPALKAAVQKCMPLAALGEFGGTVTIDPDGLTATVHAETAGAGSVKIDLPCKTTGTPHSFALNGPFLLQTLSNDAKDETTIRHHDGLSPQVVTGALATHVIMPIRTI